MTRDEFELLYECPWDIRGTNLEDVECIHTFYRGLLRETKSRDEINALRKEFGPFCWGATVNPNQIDFTYEELRSFILGEREPTQDELAKTNIANLLLPRPMLWAHMIAEKYGLPEFYAGLQYLRAIVEWDEDDGVQEADSRG